MTMFPNRTASADQVRWASGINLIAGLWLIIAPWVLGYATGRSVTNNVVVGVVVAVLAAIRFFGAYRAAGISWINVLLGLWMIVAPWVLHDVVSAAYWNDVIVGIIIAVFGAWSAMASSRAPTTMPPGGGVYS